VNSEGLLDIEGGEGMAQGRLSDATFREDHRDDELTGRG
jgi:hypothetical protein